MKKTIKLGDILVTLGVATQSDIIKARRLQMEDSDKRIGEILLSMGVISEDDLSRALSLQRDIALGFLSEEIE